MTDQYLDITKTSKYLCLAKSTLYTYVSKNKIPYIKLGDRVLFDPKDLDSWITKMKTKPIIEAPIVTKTSEMHPQPTEIHTVAIQTEIE